MSRKCRTPEEIINKLRGAEVGLAREMTVPEVSKKLGVTEQMYYRWRKEYGGLRRDQAKRLKKLVAELSLDNAILKEAAQGNF
jgi:putative transposase